MNTQISAICIANTQIREVNGLFSLTDLHRAAGGADKYQPNRWLRNKQAVDFIDELTERQIWRLKEKQGLGEEAKQALLEDEGSLRENVVKVINGGKNQGTFVCKELVVHYGMWISPAFAVEVIQTFLNSKQAPQPQLPQITRETRLPCSLESYANKLIAYLAKSQGVPAQELRHRLQEQFNHGKPLHEIRGEWAAYTYANLVHHLHEELDKLPVVDFGVSRKDLLNIFKRQCDYKRQFENWNDYQLQSWLDEQFFRNRSEHYLGYPTSLESASYAQLTVLVDKMKHILGADFKLLDLSQQKTAAALPKLRGTDGSIGQALFNYGAKTPDKSELMWALQDMASLRHTFDELLVINWDNSQLNAEQLHKVQEANTVLNNLSTMLMEAAAETLKH